MTTMKEVADYAEVSVATVSRVINKSSYVSPDLEEKVIEAMRVLKYQPSALARSLRRQETQTIGILIPQLNQPFFATLIYAVEKTLFDNDYRALICSSEESLQKEDAYIEALVRQRVDGVIVVPTGHSTESLAQLAERKVPIVLVDRDLPELQVSKVLGDNRQGGYVGMTHLLQLGHRQIAVIGGPSYSGAMTQRLQGIHEALRDYNVPELPRLLDMRATRQFQTGFDVAYELLHSNTPPTAIFALTDVMAVGVMHAASKLGFSMPRDLSVLGFDNIPLASYSIPGLSTVAQPTEEMGNVATRILLRQIEKGYLEPEVRVLNMALIIRESTAPPR